MHAAVYARVSTERQERQQTIASQLTALRAWVVEQSHDLAAEHIFRDEGYSGARLDRPGLDTLRDAVRDGAVEIIAVLNPDRLARKYAYQVLLLEEFRRAGCAVVFLQHPISDDPNDQLLLQIQGAIAEYERAVLAERFRRGKLQRAREGQVIGAKAPYGYRYEPRRDSRPGCLVIDDAEAVMVRQLYDWVANDGLSVRQCGHRLNEGPWVTRSGRALWSLSVVYHIVSDPVYAGTAYVNRHEYVVPERHRPATRRTGERTSRRARPREQWIGIPVPPLVDQDTWDRAQAQMARNAKLSFRRNKKTDYLLRCLLKCSNCGLGIHGCVFPGSAKRRPWRYYRCSGKDPLTRARATKCSRACIDADALDQVVWDHVAGLLGDPERLLAQFERFAAEATAIETAPRSAQGQIQQRIERIERADRRLVEAYQAAVISLPELAERRETLAAQRRLAEQQHAQLRRLQEQRQRTLATLESLSAFSSRIVARLQNANISDRQAILKLVVERIIVHDDHIEIEHVIPLPEPSPDTGSRTCLPIARLRSDGVAPAERQRDAGLGRGQRLVGGIAVALQDALVVHQQRLRMFGAAAWGVVEHHRRRIGAAPGPVVAGDGPGVALLRLGHVQGRAPAWWSRRRTAAPRPAGSRAGAAPRARSPRVAEPSQSASTSRLISMPWRARICDCRYSGRWSA